MNYEGAEADYSRVIEILGPESPSSAWVFYHRGTLNWMLNRPEKADADYASAFRLLTFPTYANARRFLILQDLGRPSGADSCLAVARRTLENQPWLGQILNCLAGELSPNDLVAAAENPGQRCEAAYYAAEMNRLQGDIDKANELYRDCLAQGVQTDPNLFWEPMSEYELARWRLDETTNANNSSATTTRKSGAQP